MCEQAKEPSINRFERLLLMQPEVILLDFHGTLCSTRWEDLVLLPYVIGQLESYLYDHWTNSTVERLVQLLREESFVQRFAGFRDDAPLIEQQELTQFEQRQHLQTQQQESSSLNSADATAYSVHRYLVAPPESTSLSLSPNVKPLGSPQSTIVSQHDLSSVVAFVRWQIQHRKESDTCLQLQRLIWQQGFRSNALKVQLYDDVPKVLQQWHEAGIRLYILSAVPEADLKLLLHHTQFGDMTKHLHGMLDREVGDRLQAETFKSLANRLQVQSEKMLLITGAGKVAKAADQAGLDCVLSLRNENAPLREYYLTAFESISCLNMIDFVSIGR